MAWFELKSPQQLTIYPNIFRLYSSSYPDPSLNATYVQKGIDWVSAFSKDSPNSYRPEYKSMGRTAQDSSIGAGTAFGTPLYDGSSNRIAFGASRSGALTYAGMRLSSRSQSGGADADCHVIACLYHSKPEIYSPKTFSVKAAIQDPHLLPLLIVPENPVTFTNKYYIAAKRSTGVFDITFRSLTMSDSPYVIMNIQAQGSDNYHIFIEGVTTSGFTVRTFNNAGTASDVNFGGAILFSQMGEGQRGHTVVKTPFRQAVCYSGFIDKENLFGYGSDVFPQFREFFSSRTSGGTGEINCRFKSKYCSDLGFSERGLLLTSSGTVGSETKAIGRWDADGLGINISTFNLSGVSADEESYFLAINWGDRTEY